MTLLAQYYTGPGKGARYVSTLETPYGMLLNEEYLASRIKGGEQASYDFILEIAESTLPFRNVDNLLLNLIERTTWTLDNANLRAMCDQIMSACKKAFTPDGSPATMATLGYVHFTYTDGTKIGIPSDPKVDCAGRDQKYYPHTYEAILRPHMIPALDQTINKVAEEREKRAWKWWRGYRIWDNARCTAKERKS